MNYLKNQQQENKDEKKKRTDTSKTSEKAILLAFLQIQIQFFKIRMKRCLLAFHCYFFKKQIEFFNGIFYVPFALSVSRSLLRSLLTNIVILAGTGHSIRTEGALNIKCLFQINIFRVSGCLCLCLCCFLISFELVK